MSVNWDAVHKLLSISDLAHQWPRLKALTDAAQRELEVHAEGADKENAAALKEAADKRAAEAAKHVEEVRKAEADRLAKEEEMLKKQPPGKTPAELQAEAEAARATNDQALAARRLSGEPAEKPAEKPSPTPFFRRTEEA